MELFSFEKLNAYSESLNLVAEVYKIIKMLPDNERFALCSQMQRSATSIPLNIAEGSGRISYKEKIHFLEIAFGSLLETYSQIQVSRRLGYINEDQINDIKPQFFIVSRLINALRKSFLETLENKNNHPTHDRQN